MPQVLLNISPELQSKVHSLARETNETTEQLAVRLLQEYIEDCEDADKISAEIDAGKIKTHPWQDVRLKLGLDY